MHLLDAKLVQKLGEMSPVTLGGVVEITRPISLTIPGHVRRDCACELPNLGQQPVPIFAGTRNAVHEDHGFPVSIASMRRGLSYYGSNAVYNHICGGDLNRLTRVGVRHRLGAYPPCPTV